MAMYNCLLIRSTSSWQIYRAICNLSLTFPSQEGETSARYEVFDKVSRINVYESAGPDSLPNWFLRDFAFAILELICHIFNSCVQNCIVPSLWKMANVVPVPKTKPPRSIQDDVRPISCTPALSKVLQSLVGRRILSNITPKFYKSQFGALKGRSTTHALIDITHRQHQALDDQNSAWCLFIDFTMAFDHVDHTLSLEKLSAFGTDHLILRWLHSFLYNRQQREKIGNVTSQWTSLSGGMPQGTWLGSYVFLALIDVLRAVLSLLKFVDDVTGTAVIAPSTSSQMQ
jgi:hypothetical protein